MDRVVNLGMMAHPVNWLIVWVVLMMAGLGFRLLHAHACGQPEDTGIT